MKYIALLLCLLIVQFSQGQELISSAGQEIVFNHVNVIPMDREQVLQNQAVVVKGGKIVSVTDAGKAKFSKNATIIEAGGKYLIPGIAEMHAHVPPIDDLEPMKEVLMLFAVNGITTIRGMLGHPRHLELRSKLQSGEVLGPRFYTTGPSFNGNSVKTAAQAAEMVRKQKAAGYDYLKIHPGLTKETFGAMEKTAKEAGIPFVGHVPFEVGIWQAIEAGYSSIDHLDAFIEGMVPGIENMTEQQTGLFGMFVADQADLSQIPKLIQGLKKSNTWVVPTQALAERWFAPVDPQQLYTAPEMKYMSAETSNNWLNSKKNLQSNPQYDKAKMENFIGLRRRLILECQKNGVGLLLGCDAPQIFNVPGFSTHHELAYLVASGLTPYQALQTGTINVAKYLNKENETGVIKAGAISDLLLLNGNPLTDINQTANVEGVMIGNQYMNKSYREAALKKLVKQ